MADVDMWKKAISRKFDVPYYELFVCDIWRSKCHRLLRKREMVDSINRRNDDIFIYHVPRPALPEPTPEPEKEKGDDEKPKEEAKPKVVSSEDYYRSKLPEFMTLPVQFMAIVRIETKAYFGYSSTVRKENKFVGYPFLTTFATKKGVTHALARKKIFDLIKPMIARKDDPLSMEDAYEKIFDLFITFGFNSSVKLEESEKEIDLTERNLKFCVQFHKYEDYKSELYPMEKRERDETAPPPLEKESGGWSWGGGGRSKSKPVSLESCIEAFTEEEVLDENDMWFCSSCRDFKCAKKKLIFLIAPIF